MKTMPEKFKTYKNVFNKTTEQTMIKMMKQHHFDELESPVQIGKEANVFTALKGDEKIIVKIYRVDNCDFKKMFTYIRQDPRYEHLKSHHRKVIFAWVQREYRNLLIAREGMVDVPMPRAFLNNILLLEMIGDEQPAPRAKDVIPQNAKKFAQRILKNMKLLYKAGLVHGDLSEFNILNYKDKPVFIDFSQSAPIKSYNAKEMLIRDATNISRYLKKTGIDKSIKEILKYVTGH